MEAGSMAEGSRPGRRQIPDHVLREKMRQDTYHGYKDRIRFLERELRKYRWYLYYLQRAEAGKRTLPYRKRDPTGTGDYLQQGYGEDRPDDDEWVRFDDYDGSTES